MDVSETGYKNKYFTQWQHSCIVSQLSVSVTQTKLSNEKKIQQSLFKCVLIFIFFAVDLGIKSQLEVCIWCIGRQLYLYYYRLSKQGF